MRLQDSGPAWLFSFVDLAFLLLIAMTQFSGDPNAPELGEIDVPQIDARSTGGLPSQANERWQVRVHPTEADDERPFELVTSPGVDGPAARLGADELRVQLVALHASDGPKPLLAPDADSRSADLLGAVGILDDLWPRRRGATVARLPELR